MGGQVQPRQVRVTRVEAEGDRPRGVRASAGIFRLAIFEAAGKDDPRAMLLSGDGIADRLDHALDQPLDRDPAGPALLIPLEGDRPKLRLMHLCEGRREDVEDRRSRLGLAAAQDGEQRLALRVVRSFVDDRLDLAIAEVDRSGPGDERREAKAGQVRVLKMALVDLHGDDCTAIAIGRQRIELARAPEGAVAVGDRGAPDPPALVRHGCSSCSSRLADTVVAWKIGAFVVGHPAGAAVTCP